MNKQLLSLLLGVVFLGAGCTSSPIPTESTTGFESSHETPPAQSKKIKPRLFSGSELPEATLRLGAQLFDVTGGNARGGVNVTWYEELSRYELSGTYTNLPELEDGYFYEGWVVRAEPLDVVSTGPLTYNTAGKDGWLQFFISDTDLTKHARYVLTLEPDDGDPAPAEHVLVGDMK